MAAIDTPRVQLAVGSDGRFGRLIASLRGRVADWNDARMTRNALSRLSDRELADIGLCRGDIETIGN